MRLSLCNLTYPSLRSPNCTWGPNKSQPAGFSYTFAVVISLTPPPTPSLSFSIS